MNIVEKILARASGEPLVRPDDLVVGEVGTAVMIDGMFSPAMWREILKVADPSKIVIVFDHLVPAVDAASAASHAVGRAFARRFGIRRFHDVGREQGISHVIATDYAYALPGTILVNGDSHACGGGAFNCAARGVGYPDMYLAITKGEAWFRVGETIRYELVGTLPPGVSAKDVFLHIAGTYGGHVNQNIEFGGPGMAGLGLNARRTLAVMGAELSAQFTIFEPDELLIDYVKRRSTQPFHPTWPDADAGYREVRTIDLSAMRSLVALPDAVVNSSVPVGEAEGVAIDQAFIGSCANGSLDDIEVAARIVAGRRVPPGVRLIVTPGSQEIYRAAAGAGHLQTLAEAGAVVTSATCGACIGGHMGVLGPEETCITASTRNFKGRMGHPSARIYMASPATVAASALAGRIADPAPYFQP
ncbi:aconitase/3-isopropylmalate dehydratase large subunit family protein [Pigmentiphaga soli]|uniref:Aconitase/3-isopropylmalate dehydratase large subunit family protein n=1 Tax=Pigmentiphaga soli TaxID=1007095 RepID=A0ABP8HL58_9BURK